MRGVAPDLINDDVRQRGHHQFARSLLFARTATVWEVLQGGWRSVDFTYQARSVFGCSLEEITRDVFKVIRRFADHESYFAGGIECHCAGDRDGCDMVR
jgi:hypothetical protein